MRHLGPAFGLLTALAVGVWHPDSSLAAGQPVAISPVGPNPGPGLIKEALADGVYLFRAPEALDRWTATNVVVIVNEDDVTVFDSFTRPATARLAIAEIRALTAKPVRTLINSHWHQDHWSGNDEFRKAFPGVQIIATAETRGYMTRMGSAFLIDGTRVGAAALARGAGDGDQDRPAERRHRADGRASAPSRSGTSRRRRSFVDEVTPDPARAAGRRLPRRAHVLARRRANSGCSA